VKRLAIQSLHCQPCDLFRHFCRSCIFHPLWCGPSFSRSCISQPCDLVRQFPGPAFSSPAIWSVIFQVLHCPGPAFSVAPSRPQPGPVRPKMDFMHILGRLDIKTYRMGGVIGPRDNIFPTPRYGSRRACTTVTWPVDRLKHLMAQRMLLSSHYTVTKLNKKLSYCWETVPRESMPRIAEVDVEMTT